MAPCPSFVILPDRHYRLIEISTSQTENLITNYENEREFLRDGARLGWPP